jgi:Tfp pilus assembly protein PilF
MATSGCFSWLKGPQLAEEAFTRAVDVAPQSVDAYLNLANFYRAVHRSKEAEATFKRALEVEPKSVKAYDGLAALYMETGKQTLAEPFFKTLVEIGGDERARIALSAYYVSVGRYPDAFKTLGIWRRAPRISPLQNSHHDAALRDWQTRSRSPSDRRSHRAGTA